jgi:hypothetical protein
VALTDAGGVGAPRERLAGLRAALLEELLAGARELDLPRSGYASPVAVALAVVPGRGEESNESVREAVGATYSGGSLMAVAPVDQSLRADPGAVGERGWLLVAALLGAMVQAAEVTAHTPPGGLRMSSDGRGRSGASTGVPPLELRAGALADWLALVLPVAVTDSADAAELAVLAFEDESAGIDRLRSRAYAVPAGLLEGVNDVRSPIGEDHPLRAAETMARLGGRPADDASVSAYEEEVLAVLGASTIAARPHEEQDPSLRAARRILQRLAGMGKWGGYHTDVAHLARGFAGNERALAIEVGERLVDAGLLLAKPSVGQRHVYLNPRRAADIHALIERGTVPVGLALPGR